MLLILRYNGLLSKFASKFNMRRFSSLLNALQRVLKQKVMPDAGSAAAGASASYPGAEASWPDVEKHVALRGKVGWCRLTVSTPVLKAPMHSALETTIS
jgi:hypothetical protein